MRIGYAIGTAVESIRAGPTIICHKDEANGLGIQAANSEEAGGLEVEVGMLRPPGLGQPGVKEAEQEAGCTAILPLLSCRGADVPLWLVQGKVKALCALPCQHLLPIHCDLQSTAGL